MSFENNIIQSKIDKAKETFEEGVLLFENEHYNTAVNRMYYTIFYFALACLLNENIVSKTHSGTKTMFNLHFGKSKLVSNELIDLYANLFNQRNEGDYGDLVIFTKEDVEVLIEKVKTASMEFDNLLIHLK